MQVDALLSALTTMRQRLMVIGGMYTASQAQTRLNIIDMLRGHTLAANPEEFTEYCQHKLAGPQGDTICDLLTELWEELGMASETIMWDDFAASFLK